MRNYKHPVIKTGGYWLIAETLNNAKPIGPNTGIEWCYWKQLVEHFTVALKRDNSKFNPELFKKACGLSE